MSNKKISILYNVVMPIVVAVATIALFFVFKPEEAEILFYFNLCYTLLLEAVFFGYLGLLQVDTKDFSSPFYAILGTHSLLYIVAGAACMLVYSLRWYEIFPFKIYLAAIVMLTVVWFVIAMLMTKTDYGYKQTVDELKSRQYSLQYYAQKLNILSTRYEKICVEKGIIYQTDSNNRSELDRLKAKLNFLTPNVFNNETACSQLNDLFDRCNCLLDEAETLEQDNIALHQKAMRNYVNNAINEIDLLKTLTRK